MSRTLRSYLIPVALVSAAALAAPLVAQQAAPQKPGSANPAAVTGGNYTVEPTHSQILFAYDHMGFSQNFGVISQPTGTLTLDPKNPAAAKVSVTVPLANLRTGIQPLDDHLAKPEFFDVAKFPTATFVSTGVTVNGTKAQIAGNLTIKGITKPVTLDAEFYGAGKAPPMMGGKENIGFKAKAVLKRSDFNMGYGVPMVGDDITLKIVVAFNK